MFSKPALILSLFAVSSQLVSAQTPPACLLAALNTQPNPGDLAAICGDASKQVMSQIQSLCGGNTQAAVSAYKQTCQSSGHTVSTSTPPHQQVGASGPKTMHASIISTPTGFQSSLPTASGPAVSAPAGNPAVSAAPTSPAYTGAGNKLESSALGVVAMVFGGGLLLL